MIGLVVFLILVALVTTALAAYAWGVDCGEQSGASALDKALRKALVQMDAVTRASTDAARRSARD